VEIIILRACTDQTPHRYPLGGLSIAQYERGARRRGGPRMGAYSGDCGEVAEVKPATPSEVQPNLENSRPALSLFDAASKVQAIHRGRLSRRNVSDIMQLSTARVAEIVSAAAKQFIEDITDPTAGDPFELTDCSEVIVQQQLSRLRNAHRKRNTPKNASSARFRWGVATVCCACGSNLRLGNSARDLLPHVIALACAAVSPEYRDVRGRGPTQRLRWHSTSQMPRRV
jgi:hypothetical protein